MHLLVRVCLSLTYLKGTLLYEHVVLSLILSLSSPSLPFLSLTPFSSLLFCNHSFLLPFSFAKFSHSCHPLQAFPRRNLFPPEQLLPRGRGVNRVTTCHKETILMRGRSRRLAEASSPLAALIPKIVCVAHSLWYLEPTRRHARSGKEGSATRRVLVRRPRLDAPTPVLRGPYTFPLGVSVSLPSFFTFFGSNLRFLFLLFLYFDAFSFPLYFFAVVS